MRSDNELLRELQRLSRSGIINDEEFRVLRKIIVGGRISPEFYRRFDRLFAGESKSVPVETIKEKRDLSMAEKPFEKGDKLYSMAEAINELNLTLTMLGGFDNSRELLRCPACGLFEDVTVEGMLITAESEYPSADTGLRFVKVNDDEWKCPDCGQFCPESPTT